MPNAFYAAFGTCRRRGYTKSYCYEKAKKDMKRLAAPSRRRKRSSKRKGFAVRGSRCIRKTKVWSPALGKQVYRCTGGYRRR